MEKHAKKSLSSKTPFLEFNNILCYGYYRRRIKAKIMSRGITMIEILVVIIIIGIVASLSVFTNTEHDRGREGETILGLIYQAEKRYSMDNNGEYYTCSPCSTTLIKDNLGIDIRPVFFTYTIAVGATTGFTATATRIGTGECATKTMTVTDLSGQVVKGCSAW